MKRGIPEKTGVRSGDECPELIYMGHSVTVFGLPGRREVLVYGSGGDWILQAADVTNGRPPWRKWFARRDDAERAGIKFVNEARDYPDEQPKLSVHQNKQESRQAFA